MPDILTELKSKYGETIDAVEKRELKEAFGTDEAVALIDLLYNNVETLDSGIQDLQGSMKNGISVTEEMAEAINNTPEQKFQVLKQQIHNNVEELGNGLLQQYHGQSERTDTEGFQVDKQQSGNGSEHYEHSPEAWSIPCDSRKRDGCDRKPWKAFPVSKERYRTCEDRNLGNEYSLPCFPYNVGDSRNSGSSSRLCSPME